MCCFVYYPPSNTRLDPISSFSNSFTPLHYLSLPFIFFIHQIFLPLNHSIVTPFKLFIALYIHIYSFITIFLNFLRKICVYNIQDTLNKSDKKNRRFLYKQYSIYHTPNSSVYCILFLRPSLCSKNHHNSFRFCRGCNSLDRNDT